MIIGILFGLAAVVALLALMLRLAAFTLPLLIAIGADRLAVASGAGVAVGVVVGLIVGVATLAAGQLILAPNRSSAVRMGAALLFAGPAAYAAYHLVLGVSRIGGGHGAWQPIFADGGALAVGAAALVRLVAHVVPAPVLIGPRPAGGLHSAR